MGSPLRRWAGFSIALGAFVAGLLWLALPPASRVTAAAGRPHPDPDTGAERPAPSARRSRPIRLLDVASSVARVRGPIRVRFVDATARMGLGSGTWWIVTPDPDTLNETGPVDPDGNTTLTIAAILAWQSSPLHLSLDGSLLPEQEIAAPPTALEDGTEILVPLPGRHVRIAGSLFDAQGAPVGQGAVFAFGEGLAGEPGARADSGGRFVLDLLLQDAGVAPGGGVGGGTEVTLFAVAPGHASSRRGVPGRDASDVDFRLDPATDSGSLTLKLLHPDGRPAVGARAWVWPVGRPPPSEGRPFDDEEGLRTRGFLVRAFGGRSIDDQGWEVCLGENRIRDFVTDAQGEVTFAALPAGGYRVLACAGLSTDGVALYGERELYDGWEKPEGSAQAATEALETEISVLAAPRSTRAERTLNEARTVVGRLVVDERADWKDAGCGEWTSWIGVDGWPWLYSIVTTGTEEDASGAVREFPGTFRVMGLPEPAHSLHVRTSHLASTEVDVPAATPGSQPLVDVGAVHVRWGRLIEGRCTWADGSDVEEASLHLERYVGAAAGYARGGTIGAFLLETPLTGQEMLRVEVAGPVAKTYRVPLRLDPPAEGRLRITVVLPEPRPTAATSSVPAQPEDGKPVK